MMQMRTASRGWLWARTLYLLFAALLYWVSCLNWDAYLYGTVFVMAPWAVLLVAGSVARRQLRWNAYNILMFAAAGFYALAALRNGNLTPRGLLVLALGIGTVWLGVRAFSAGGASRRRALTRAGFFLLAASLAVLLATVICEFFGHGDWLPWGTRRVASRGARSANSAALLLRSQKRTLKGLTVLTYACGAMLVAGIVPEDADAAHLRREGMLLCLAVAVPGLVYLAPALATVFTGRPIRAEWLPSVVGIQAEGLVSDRIWALMHPNKAAMLAVAGIFCALYVLRGTRRRWARALLAAMMVVDAMALAHCQSRTGDIALGVGLGALAFRGVWLRLAGKRGRAVAGLAAWALALALTVLLVNGLYTADVLAATRLGASAENNFAERLREEAERKRAELEMDTSASDNPVEVADGVVVSRTLAAGFLDVFSNGRDEIWRAGADYLAHNPMDLLLGMGSGDIMERVNDYDPGHNNANHLHNSFLETLARGGAFMLIALIWALCLLARPAARMLTDAGGADPGAPVFPVLIGVLLAISLVEALLFTDAAVYNLLFFYAAGRVMNARTLPAN